MATDPREKSIGIKDIAKALRISIGTVDRALHNRPGISEKTKTHVLETAAKLGYQPNLAAQTLKRNRRLSIAAVLPKEISHFFDPLRAGIRAAAAAAVGMQIHLEFYEYTRMGAGDIETLQRAQKQRFNGIILLPGDTKKYQPLMKKLAHSGTALMCVGSDAPKSERIGAVTAHAYVSGAIAAELLSYKLQQPAAVAVFTGELATLDHAEKLRGFTETLSAQAPHLKLLPPIESHDLPQNAYRQALAMMRGRTRPAGIYLTTANSAPVLKALQELGLLGETALITTDLFHQLVPLIEQRQVLATLYQRPYTQGKLAFEKLIAYLLTGDKAQATVRLAPHVILRSNLALFSDQVAEVESRLDPEPRQP